MSYTILIVEDDLTACETLVEAFTEKGYRVLAANDGRAAIEILKAESIDIMLTDLKMPNVDGMTLVEISADKFPVILMTAYSSIADAVHATKLGAFDFISKPIDIHHLFTIVENALQMNHLLRENISLKKMVKNTYDYCGMIGRAPVMQEIFEQIDQVAPTNTTVFITGESGTGKELVANAVHDMSTRKDKPYIKINCAAIPGNLLESELFGHERGSFTGAVAMRKGKFELANGGTLLLDELCEMDLALQSKLLRVLQEREFERVGGSELIKVDVRVIGASNADVQKSIREGLFREDLFYRMSVFNFELPPLRNRRQDIDILADFFVRKMAKTLNKKIAGISTQVLDAMRNYSWPGNIRQMQNMIERASVLVPENAMIELKQLPTELRDFILDNNLPKIDQNYLRFKLPEVSMEDLEHLAIQQALNKFHGNKIKAAHALNIGVKTLYRKIEKFNINK